MRPSVVVVVAVTTHLREHVPRRASARPLLEDAAAGFFAAAPLAAGFLIPSSADVLSALIFAATSFSAFFFAATSARISPLSASVSEPL